MKCKSNSLKEFTLEMKIFYPGESVLSRGSVPCGGQGATPPEAEEILKF